MKEVRKEVRKDASNVRKDARKNAKSDARRNAKSNISGSYDEQIRNLELTSDIFFGVVLEDKKVCEEFLRILIGREIRVKRVQYQYSIRQLTNRSVILDIWAEELNGECINIEIHPQSGEDRVRRMRYNFASIDTKVLNVSEDYSNIPDILGIYITKGDFLKSRRGINKVVRYVEDTNIEIPNGIEEYYINLKCEGNTPEQTALFQYIMSSDGIEESDIFPELVKRVRFLKEERGRRSYMCEIMDDIMDEIREIARVEGREEGREEGQVIGMAKTLKMLNYGMQDIIKNIVEVFGISEEEAMQLID